MHRYFLSLALIAALAAGCAGITKPAHWTIDPQSPESTALQLYRFSEDAEMLLGEVTLSGLDTPEVFSLVPFETRTMISMTLARRLGLEVLPSTTWWVETLSEKDRIFLATIPEVRIGDLVLKDFKVRVYNDRFSDHTMPPVIAGRIGMDVLKYMRLTYDREQETLHLSRGDAIGLPPGDPAQTGDLSEKRGYTLDLEDLGYRSDEHFRMGTRANFHLGVSGIVLVKKKFDFEGKPAEMGPMYYEELMRPRKYIRFPAEFFRKKEMELLGITARNVNATLSNSDTIVNAGAIGTDIWPDYVLAIDYPGEEIRFHKRPKVGERVKVKLAFDRVVELTQSALTKHPDDARLHHRLGKVLQHKGRHIDALTHLQKAATLDSKNGRFREDLGHLLLHLGQHDEAQAAFEEAAKVQPNRPGPLTNVAWRRFKSGDTKGAQEAAEQLLERWEEYEKGIEKDSFFDDPDHLDVPLSRRESAEFLLARLAYEKNEGRKVIDTCREIIKIRGEHDGCRTLMARQYMRDDQFQPSLDQWEFWLSYDHGQVETVIHEMRKAGKLKRFADRLEFLVKRHPGKVGLYRGAARTAEISGDLEALREWAKKTEEVNPDHFGMLHAAADIYTKLGDKQKVLEIYDRFESADPPRLDRSTSLDRAGKMIRMDQLAEAEKWIERAAKLADRDEERAAPARLKAEVAVEREDWAAAVAAFEERLKHWQDPQIIRFGYAEALMNVGRKDEAAKLLAPVIRWRREDLRYEISSTPSDKASLANALRILGQDLEEAQKLAREAVDAKPERVWFCDVLGKVEQALGNKDAAAAAFKMAQKTEPWSSRWKRRLEKVGS